MFDFIRRIPGLFRRGQKRDPDAPAGRSAPVSASSGGKARETPRGRGTGRGLTPPSKPKGNRPQNRGKR